MRLPWGTHLLPWTSLLQLLALHPINLVPYISVIHLSQGIFWFLLISLTHWLFSACCLISHSCDKISFFLLILAEIKTFLWVLKILCSLGSVPGNTIDPICGSVRWMQSGCWHRLHSSEGLTDWYGNICFQDGTHVAFGGLSSQPCGPLLGAAWAFSWHGSWLPWSHPKESQRVRSHPQCPLCTILEVAHS